MSIFHGLMGATAGFLSIICVVPYIIGTLKGETKPHRVTWWILSFLGLLMSANHFQAGGITTGWVPLCAAIGQLVIAILSLRFGKGGWGLLDRLCLAGAVISLVVWQQLDSPMVAMWLTIGVDFMACLPTICKVIGAPESEDFTCWMLYFVGTAINLLAVPSWTLEQAAVPVYLFFGNGLILSLLWGYQLRRWEKQYRFVRGVSPYQYDRVLLFHLNGPMIGKRSRDVDCGQIPLQATDKLVMDFTKVPFVGFRSSRKIASTLRYAHENGIQLYIVGASRKIQKQLGRLGLYDLVHTQNIMSDSAQALQRAVRESRQQRSISRIDWDEIAFQML